MARLDDLSEWEHELMLIKLKDLRPLGGTPWVKGNPPEAFVAQIRADAETYGKLAAELHIRLN